MEPNKNSKEADLFTPEAMDECLTAELSLPHGDTMQRARVLRRHKDEAGLQFGRRDDNPILDSRMHEIEFLDGSTEMVTANLIAENLFSQVDEQGQQFQIMEETLNCGFTDKVVKPADGFMCSQNGQLQPVITTKGCELLVKWKDGSTDWVPLKDLENSNPVEVAECALAHKPDHTPCFNWWDRKVICKQNRIIKKVKPCHWKRTHKHGIELPHSVAEALVIDCRTGTTFWADAMAKEMKKAQMTFKIPEDDVVPPRFTEIKCHMIFDTKSALVRKARFMTGGHLTDPSKESVFSGVVTRDSIWTAFVAAALNVPDILAADVQNAHPNAPTKEKCWF